MIDRWKLTQRLLIGSLVAGLTLGALGPERALADDTKPIPAATTGRGSNDRVPPPGPPTPDAAAIEAIIREAKPQAREVGRMATEPTPRAASWYYVSWLQNYIGWGSPPAKCAYLTSNWKSVNLTSLRLYAFSVSNGADWQTLSYFAMLYSWNGSSWVRVATQWSPQYFNVWEGSSAAFDGVSFRVTGEGYWSMQLIPYWTHPSGQYVWYTDPRVPWYQEISQYGITNRPNHCYL